MNVLSLFDGMSCGQIALERVGIKVDKYFAAEIDKHAIKVTMANYPDTIQLGDVTKIKSEDLPKIDLLIGGSPCQGFSFAGKQLNFDDSRSKLFFEYVRLLNEIKPKYFLLENVKMKRQYQDIISIELGLPPIEINSALVSAHSRKRLYWTNIPNLSQPDDRGILLKDIIEDDIDAKYFLTDEKVNKYKEIINYKKDKTKSCVIGKFGNYQSDRAFDIDCKGSSLCATGGGTAGGSCNIIQVGSLYKNNGDAGRIYSVEGKGRTLKAEGGGGGAKMGLISKDNGITFRKLTPIECERLQCVPDNYTETASSTQRYRMLGNGWTVDVIAHIFKEIIA